MEIQLSEDNDPELREVLLVCVERTFCFVVTEGDSRLARNLRGGSVAGPEKGNSDGPVRSYRPYSWCRTGR